MDQTGRLAKREPRNPLASYRGHAQLTPLVLYHWLSPSEAFASVDASMYSDIMVDTSHQGLNGPQRQAVEHDEGPILVLAGAGSGKTRVITHRIARLIRNGIAPTSLMAMTFTNKAAHEMKERASVLLGYDIDGMWIGTFHATCARLLRNYGEHIGLPRSFTIYDDADQRALISRILKDLNIASRSFSPSAIAHLIEKARQDGVSPNDYIGNGFTTDIVAKVYPEYENRLLESRAVDFAGLLSHALKLLHSSEPVRNYLCNQFTHLLVDEFQDTNSIQYQLVQLLSGPQDNLCVVGDDDQSIYSWRGADIRNILEFEHDFPNALVVRLEQNYRSTQNILDAAGSIISKNLGRKEKTLWTDEGSGDPITVVTCNDENEEARLVAQTINHQRIEQSRSLNDVAIFYRTHAQSRVLEEALRAANPPIPHVVIGGMRFYDRAEIKDLLAYLRLTVNRHDDVALMRIVNVPARGIGAKTVDKLVDYAKAQGVCLYDALMSLEHEASFAKGAKAKLSKLAQVLSDFTEQSSHLSCSSLTEHILERSGYAQMLASDDSPNAQARVENIMELVSSMRQFEQSHSATSIVDYLEQAALLSDADKYDENAARVTLMTVHSAKGLEFPAVFVVGLEQGIFPHVRSLDDPASLEEERRLAYVAVTRARQQLFLSRAETRWFLGKRQINPPSEIIRCLPYSILNPINLSWRKSSPERFDDKQSSRPQKSLRRPSGDSEPWVDYTYDQSNEQETTFFVGMRVHHERFGDGEIRVITGSPPNANLTIFFDKVGPRTIRSQYIEPISS